MRTLYLIILTCFFQVLMGQEIKINIDKELSINDTVCFNVKNCTKQDIWFNTYGLVAKIYVKDSSGKMIPPTSKVEADPLNLPEFILIEAGSVKNICIPLGKFSKYDLLEGEEYYMFFEYENFYKKPKSKIKTYTGEIEIQPLRL